ncbi:MAG TPA: LysM domain-containing protein [Thermoleophilaceae bacterium]|jgi:LysM repeat protein
MTNHGRRSPARFLAPLALLVVVAAVAVTISNAGLGDGSDSSTTPTEQTSAPKPKTTKTKRKPTRRNYVIKTGDTLGAISEKTGVSVERLQQLNPELDPQALVAGQRIKLRE